MNYISTNYDTRDDTPVPYDEAFIRHWKGKLDVDAKLLEQTLAEAFGEYLSLKIYCNCYERWYQARDQFQSIHRALTRTKKLWKCVSASNREAFDLFGKDQMCFADVEAQLNEIHDVVDEMLEWGARPRGNQGRSRKRNSIDVDLDPLHSFTCVIDKFWRSNVDQPFGIKIEGDYEKGREDDDNDNVSEAISLGISFVHARLQKLEPGIDAATCQTLMRKLRTKKSRA